ncbi:SLBB domain-containing protein [Olivibacter jilunii]|uniref:SLBB domain-containing protein n=1 Tax=Olivibacter jilunii TaxID=985016 RepID=UPI003F17BD03
MIKKYVLYVAQVLLIGFFVFLNETSFAQSIDPQNLSSINVDELSDDQIREFIKQAESSGLSETEMIQMAKARGMSQTEIDKLRSRIEQVGGPSSTTTKENGLLGDESRIVLGQDDSLLTAGDSAAKTPAQLAEEALRSRIYGGNLFINSRPMFEPNLRVATPMDYVIGPDDELRIEVYGNSEVSHRLNVSPDGTINIPYVGIVEVAGASIEQATARIKATMANIYTAIRNGTTKVNVRLGNIRSIKVIITGEVVKPGTYTLPSVATVFNALYSSGGPTSKGSLRSIKVIRAGKTIADLDVYDFLQNGIMEGNVSLRDQDIIQVSPYLSRVEMMGEVKRPMLFETKPGETFEDLLRYAGGFTEEAYTSRISVIRNTGKERRLEDILESQYTQFEPKTGDRFTIERLLDRYANRVTINGAVFRPGEYELSAGLTLSMLIKKADGIKEDAFTNRGYIIRLKDDFQREQISFSVAEVIAGTAADIPLKREDIIFISSIFDLRNEYTVEINGEVRSPGKYDYAEGMTLEELIMQAGGFTESGSGNRVEIARRVSDAEAMSTSATTAEIFHVNLDRSLKEAADFELKPFDMVSVRTEAGYVKQRMVRVEGEVLYPGEYSISRKDERISDIIKRAGGFTPYAYIDGVSLKRKDFDATHIDSTSNLDKQRLRSQEELKQERIARLQALQQSTRNTDATPASQTLNNSYVGINMTEILKKPGQLSDLILEEGDILRVPKQLQTVKVSGEVLSPVTVVYSSNKGFKQYISQAGGFSQRALRKRSYVVYANGSARSTSKFLFFNNYPKIKPGSEIFVPQRLERERMNAAQWVGLGSGIATALGVIVALFRN